MRSLSLRAVYTRASFVQSRRTIPSTARQKTRMRAAGGICVFRVGEKHQCRGGCSHVSRSLEYVPGLVLQLIRKYAGFHLTEVQETGHMQDTARMEAICWLEQQLLELDRWRLELVASFGDTQTVQDISSHRDWLNDQLNWLAGQRTHFFTSLAGAYGNRQPVRTAPLAASSPAPAAVRDRPSLSPSTHRKGQPDA